MNNQEKSKPKLSGLAKLMGIELIDFKIDSCTVGAYVSTNHLNAGGVAHGGLHATMLDTALGGALVSSLNKNEWCATAQLDISYINAAYKGVKLTAIGKVLRRGKTLAHCEGILSDPDGKIIAKGKGTWIIWEIKPKSLL